MISSLEYIVIFITILTIITIPIIFRLIISQQITQQALRWWYQRQHVKMSQEAEFIRNQMLQELFVLRRHIELTQLKNSPTSFDKNNLDRIQQIHSSLLDLSEYLYPAYLDDSLPLAIQYFVESWKSRLSHLNIELELPQEWEKESEEMSRILLMVLNESFEILRVHYNDCSSVLVSLKKTHTYSQLKLEILYNFQPHYSDYGYLQELKYLGHIFKKLTGGKFDYMRNKLSQVWYFNW